MKNKHILISGASIAGLTLAYWLKKAGFSPTLVEKHTSIRQEGYKLDIRGTATDVLKQMNLYEKIFDARTDITRAQYVNHEGTVISESTPDLCGVRSNGDLEINRGRLCEILHSVLDGVEIVYGDSIKSLQENDTGVLVEFNNAPARKFDLVVGADGIHSEVRRLHFGPESQFLRELGIYVSYFSIPNYLNLDRVEIEYHEPGRFALAYCPKNGLTKVGFAFSSPPLALGNRAKQQEYLINAYAKEGWQIPRFLELMPMSDDFYFDCMAQVVMPHWTRGRVALVGDAGYAVSPISGQGASVALVGAYTLARELAKESDHQKAFSSYEASLKEYVQQNQGLARLNIELMAKEETGLTWLHKKLSEDFQDDWVQLIKKFMTLQTQRAANVKT